MNVSCPDCHSVYRIDPAKVTSERLRARCSVCGGIIPVGAATSWADAFSDAAAPDLNRHEDGLQPTEALGEGERAASDAISSALPAGLWPAARSTPIGHRPILPDHVAVSPSEIVVKERVEPSLEAVDLASQQRHPGAVPGEAVELDRSPGVKAETSVDTQPHEVAVQSERVAVESSPEVPAQAQLAKPTPNDASPASPSGSEQSPPDTAKAPQPTPLIGSIAALPPAGSPPIGRATPAGSTAFGRATPGGSPPIGRATPAVPGRTIPTPRRLTPIGGNPSYHRGPTRPASPAFGAPLPPPPRTSFPTPIASPTIAAPTGTDVERTADRRPINPFLANDPNQKARRLARALVSDMIAYHPGKREDGLRNGTLKQLFREEIKKSYEEYVEQIGREFAEATTHFQDALNDVLSGGKKLF